MCVPQVIYVFSYANSDASGLAFSMLLLLQTARMIERAASQWRIWSIICLHTSSFYLTLLSKTPVLTWAYWSRLSCSLRHLIRDAHGLEICFAPHWQFHWWQFTQLAGLVESRAFRPGTRQWHEKMTAMRQDKAMPAATASQDDNPAPGIYLSSRGWTLHANAPAQ